MPAPTPTIPKRGARLREYRRAPFARLGGMRAAERNPPPAAPGNGVRKSRAARAAAPASRSNADEPPAFTREHLLTASDVADILQVKRTTALDYMRRGVIPARKIGRRWYALRPRLDEYIGDLFEPGPYR